MTRYILLFILLFHWSFCLGQQKGIVANTIREAKRMIDTARYISVDNGAYNVYLLKVTAADSNNYCMSVWYIVRPGEFPMPEKKYVLALDSQFVILDVPAFLYSKIAAAYPVFPLDDNSRQLLRKKLESDGVLIMREYVSAIVSCYNSDTYSTKYFRNTATMPDDITPYNAQETFKDRSGPPKMDTIPIIPHNLN